MSAEPKEPFAGLVVSQAKAGLAQTAARDGKCNDLAVDEDAVAIENDDFRPARRLHRLADLALCPLERLVGPTLSRVERGNFAAGGVATISIVDMDAIAETIVCFPAAMAPTMADPSRTGSGVCGAPTVFLHASAMIWRTKALAPRRR